MPREGGVASVNDTSHNPHAHIVVNPIPIRSGFIFGPFGWRSYSDPGVPPVSEGSDGSPPLREHRNRQVRGSCDYPVARHVGPGTRDGGWDGGDVTRVETGLGPPKT